MTKYEFDSTIKSTLGMWKKTLLDLKDIESKEYVKFKGNELNELNKIKTIVSDYYNSMIKLTPGNEAIDFWVEDIYGKEYSLKDFEDKVTKKIDFFGNDVLASHER